ncbi:recombination protein NinB, partial [Salmonella enterica subsp. enterica serovar Cerro]|nr:recombination protein NinB [Salmonella enterica subsp. enterica serovar Cerro]
GIAQLPSGASLDRTEAVVKQMSAIALAEPGVESVVVFPGLSVTAALKQQDVVPNLAGDGFVVIGQSTSRMRVSEFAELLELIQA